MPPEGAGLSLKQEQICECATDIDAESVARAIAGRSPGKRPTFDTIAGNALPMTPENQRDVAISASRLSPVIIDDRSSM